MRALAALRVQHRRLETLQVGGLPHHAALDAGIALAKSEVVLLLDDDVLPGPGLASGHARHHAAAQGLVVMGYMPVKLSTKRRPADIAEHLYSADYEHHCNRIEAGETGVLDELWTGNVSASRADCLRVGIESPLFTAFYHADRDLGLRLADAGLYGVFDRALGATHLHTRSTAEFLRDSERQGRGRVALWRAQSGRLGNLDPTLTLADLPVPVRAAVRAAGGTRLAVPAARTLIAMGVFLGHVRLWRAEVLLAKLARRVMQVRGVTAELKVSEVPRGASQSRERVTRRARMTAPPPSGSSSLPPARPT